MEDFGERLATLRQQMQLTQRELENEIDISHGVITKLENKETSYPSIPIAMKLSKFFGVSLDYLVGMPETQRRRKKRHVTMLNG